MPGLAAVDLNYPDHLDGLSAGSVLVPQTLELLHALDRFGYDRAIYFDPIAEGAANFAAVEGMARVLDRLRGPALDAALARQDAVASQRILQAALYGPP